MATRELAVPFAIDPLGRVAFVEDPTQQIGQHLQMLVGTQARTRLMEPDYGVDLLGYLFETDDAATQQRLVIEIETAIQAWEPQAEVQQIIIDSGDERNALIVTVYYSVIGVNEDRALNTATIKIDGTTVTTSG